MFTLVLVAMLYLQRDMKVSAHFQDNWVLELFLTFKPLPALSIKPSL